MRGLPALLADVWRLSRPYFVSSDERWSARMLLGAIIALDLSRVGMTVVLSFWNRAFYNALEQKDWESFIKLLLLGDWDGGQMMPGFCVVAAVYIVVAIYRTYLSQWLEINWRRWLTERLLDDWLAHRAYFRLSLMPGAGAGDAAANGHAAGAAGAIGAGAPDAMTMSADNPDQRISEDTKDFVSSTLSLSLGLLSSVVSLFSFVTILWSLSGPLVVLGISVPGYLVWVAVIYAILGTWLTHKVGRPLAMLDFLQQKVEANFRFSLARLRENVEGIALYRGEAAEAAALKQRFAALTENWWAIMWRTKKVIALTAGYNQAAGVFPIIVVAPRFFSGEITLGALTQTAGSFSRVEDALSYFVNAYRSFAVWRATVGRLAGFRRAVDAAHAAARAGDGVAVTAGSSDSWQLHDMQVRLPTGRVLIEEKAMALAPGNSVVVTGRSGSGKSTLFRALAGIWPFGGGTVEKPPGSQMFLPQRPYLPLGTLRGAVAYPADPAEYGDARLREALEAVGLGHLADSLDEEQAWAQRLSGGEQQRVAVARALLARPDWLFLDEATASLDPESEAQVYALLRRHLPGTTIVSIAHRPAVAEMHDRKLVLRDGRLQEAG